MKTLHLGIVAHVDAGKTSLTERLLFNAGVIASMGSVDKGTTQTDSLEMERERGITIQSGVVSFPLEDLTVYLIDTPGHPDFIGEVERSLKVLDGVILVISAVEGIQTQTRLLMQAIKNLNIPLIIFVNKIDRRGARYEDLIENIKTRLTPHVSIMSTVANLGTPHATVSSLRASQPSGCPIFFGSAVTGAGVTELQYGIRTLLPSTLSSPEGPLQGTVFKIERGPRGEKIVYLRLYSGQIRVRQTVTFYRHNQSGNTLSFKEKITAIHVHRRQTPVLTAGHIAKLEGLQRVQIGDQLHTDSNNPKKQLFSPPTLEVEVYVEEKSQKTRLFTALQSIAEQDPWLHPITNARSGEITVYLYGEIQKEVLQARLEQEFSLTAHFRDPKTVFVEKVMNKGEMLQEIHRKQHNEFYATIGLKIEPGERNSGVEYRLGVEKGCIPKSYHTAIEESVLETLKKGPCGWNITDCIVTLTKAGICPLSTPSEFRKATPFVLMQAIRQAKTCICEPISTFELESPSSMLNAVITLLIESGAILKETEIREDVAFFSGKIPSNRIYGLEKQLPDFTQGRACFFYHFEGYDPVKSPIL